MADDFDISDDINSGGGSEFESEFESEFDSEFDSEKEKKEEDKKAEEAAKQAEAAQKKDQPPDQTIEEPLPEKKPAIVIKVLGILTYLLNVKKIIFEGIPFLKKKKIVLLGYKLTYFFLVKTALGLIASIILLSMMLSYYAFLNQIFDDSFLYETESELAGVSDIAYGDEDELSEADELAMEELGAIFYLKNIIINVKKVGAKKSKMLKLSLGLELEDEDALDELQVRKKQLRHIIIVHFSNIKVDNIHSKKLRRTLKADIKKRLNGILKTGSIRRIFFTELVMN